MGVRNKAKAAVGTQSVAPVKADAPMQVDEIDQIMSEIEELQEEMGAVQEQSAEAASHASQGASAKLSVIEGGESAGSSIAEEAAASVLEEFRGSGDEPSMEETLADLKGDENHSTILDEQVEQIEQESGAHDEDATTLIENHDAHEEGGGEVMAKDHDHETTGEAGEGTLSMTLSGSMTLKLQYQSEGQEVTIGFVDGALHVALADGTEFKIPVGRKKALRRAA